MIRRRKLLFLVLLCFVVTSVSAQQNTFQLSLTRKYGRAGVQECRLDIEVDRRLGSGTASLHCIPNNTAKPPVVVQKALSTNEGQSLIDLLARPTLFDGELGNGTDSRPVDGVFETLEVHIGSKAVVAVTSGNLVFVESAPRKQLLDLIKAIEQRLSAGVL